MSADTKIINLTSKPIYILKEKYFDIETPIKQFDIDRVKNTMCDMIPVSGREAFCALQRHSKNRIGDNIRISLTAIGGVTNESLPIENENTVYIVPNVVYNSLHLFRKDLYTVDEPIKTTSGLIVACKSLTRTKYTMIDKEKCSIIHDIDRLLVEEEQLTPELYTKIATIRLRLVKITF